LLSFRCIAVGNTDTILCEKFVFYWIGGMPGWIKLHGEIRFHLQRTDSRTTTLVHHIWDTARYRSQARGIGLLVRHNRSTDLY